MDEKAFFRRIAGQLHCDERRAEGVTFAVFQELRNRLTPKQVSHVEAQLAIPLKALWRSLDKPDRCHGHSGSQARQSMHSSGWI